MEQASGMARPCNNFTIQCSREVEGSREKMNTLSRSYKTNRAAITELTTGALLTHGFVEHLLAEAIGMHSMGPRVS